MIQEPSKKRGDTSIYVNACKNELSSINKYSNSNMFINNLKPTYEFKCNEYIPKPKFKNRITKIEIDPNLKWDINFTDKFWDDDDNSNGTYTVKFP